MRFLQIFIWTVFVAVGVLGSLDLDLAKDTDVNSHVVEEFDGFVSYRRSASRHLAMLIKVLLKEQNITAFVDVEDLHGGVYHEQLFGTIEASPNFILVLSNGTLERAKGDSNYTDFLHREIKTAVDNRKRIIPVFDDFDWPSSDNFSPEINFALENQGVNWQYHLVEQSLERLISYMRFPIPMEPTEIDDHLIILPNDTQE